MHWKQGSRVQVLYFGYILVLPSIVAQPCKPGFKLATKQDCIDINECAEDGQICKPNESCLNTVGSYHCACKLGLRPYFNAPDMTPCQDPAPTPSADRNLGVSAAGQRDHQLTAAAQQPALPEELFCSTGTKVSRLFKFCHEPVNGLLIEDAILSMTGLLVNKSPLMDMGQDERISSASSILTVVERAAITLGLSSAGNGVKNIFNKEMDLQVIRVNSTPPADGVRLHANGNALDVFWRAATNTSGFAVFAFVVYHSLNSVLQGALYQNQENGHLYKDVRLHSKVISATLEFSTNTSFSVDVNFVLKHEEVVSATGRLSCVYWSHTGAAGHWSTRGCQLVRSNASHTICQCQHFSSFAILTVFSKKQLQGASYGPLSIITLIGIPVSLTCLLLALGTFICCPQAHNSLSALHTQLCFSLFLAQLLFILGIHQTGQRVVCGLVAGCLHYLFLVTFAWMSLESMQLYIMVRNLKEMRVSKSGQGKFAYTLGYGAPALIVVISALIYPDGYGSEQNCWLQVENGFVWSFLGPIYLIILVNTFLFTRSLYMLNEELSKRDMKVSKIKNTKMLMLKAIAQVFILGCTWIFGLFHFQEETVVMAYLFTIVNSFQGTFIFIILCILNPKIRAEYQKWVFSIFKTKRILFESESTKMPLSVTSDTA
ncbi:adhesion G protein-coupled receptor E3-like isoform X2 [Narcine bancroftii]|uniref:adhesion G protein-coupled receptor E3-like isoform X2 n=1 Tax=Narcine bancroftii TaxID=1343680 RepID=UPI00383163A6